MRSHLRYIPGFGILALLAAALIMHAFNPRSIAFLEDQALTAAVSSLALQGELPLLGPPSHIGGRHLGPVLYYLEAALLWLAGGDLARAYSLGAFVKALGFLLFGSWLVRSFPEPHRPWAWVGVACTMSAPLIFDGIRVTWHSNWIPLFAFALLWSTERLRSSGYQAAPLFLLVASLCVQLHFSMAPLVVAAATFGWLTMKRPSSMRSLLLPAPLGCFALSVLSWLPLVIYELRYGPNLSAIASHSSETRADAGIRESLLTFFDFVGQSSLTPMLTRDHAALGGAALIVMLIVIMLALSRISRPAQEIRGMLGIGFLGATLYILALAFGPAPVHEYYFTALVFLPLLALTILFGHARDSWLARIPATLIFLATLTSLHYRLTEQAWARVAPYHSLAHMKALGTELALVLAPAAPQNSPAQLDTRGHAVWGRDGYLFFLGRDYWSQMNWQETLLELPTMQRNLGANSESILIVQCPFPNSSARKQLEEQLVVQHPHFDAASLTPVNLSSCGAPCRGCLVLRLKK